MQLPTRRQILTFDILFQFLSFSISLVLIWFLWGNLALIILLFFYYLAIVILVIHPFGLYGISQSWLILLFPAYIPIYFVITLIDFFKKP